VNRALRAATMGALLAASVTLSACGAGQVNQTSMQNRDKVGPSVEQGEVELRQVQLAYPGEREQDDPTTRPESPGEGGVTVYTDADGAPLTDESTFYEAGDDAELIVTIVNDGAEDVRLTDISAEGFDGVINGEPPAEGATAGSGTTTSGTTTSGTTTGTGTASRTISIVVRAQSSLTIGLRQYEPATGDVVISSDTQRVFLADMSREIAPLTPGLTVPVTFTFQGLQPLTVDALVAGPYVETTRGDAYDFKQGEGADTGDEQDTEAE
jgi:hypothetical protein